MTTIIAGRFAQQDAVQHAIAALEQAGAPPAQITSFYVNPAGQHDQYPVGGDRDESPGAEDVDKGSVAGMGVGGAAGAAAGAATAPATGPLGAVAGALVGAHIGSLIGSLSQTEEDKDIPPVRQSGMLVAVSVTDAEEERRAIETLRAAGGTCLERAQGQIVDGDWIDFDPLSSPDFVSASK
ncbi:MAG: hypothetical protein REI95_00420 [Oxalicibacterium faecigallinarum]|uniref:hypothetical protein n=1 Tax=Oxalicibacterium faecigallinarum TaxID=573741 RepID=UPI0028093788|nr:hypothetical protein [Oxalicibacterium faecigallinarum]MDQ7968084.1 hypothetical protein [Oxalicibacterium faecigallinarum]